MPTSAPTSFPPLLLPSDRPEVNLPPRMGLGLALGPGYEVGESSAAAAARPAGGFRADYGFVATMDRQVRRDPERVEIIGFGLQERRMAQIDFWLSPHTTNTLVFCLTKSDLLETDRRRREEMRELRAADRTRQQQIIQTLTVMQTLQREMIPLQGLVTTLQGQVTALQGQVMTLQGQVTALQGQQGPAGGPAQPELPEEAGSSS
ncbi:hypothetical protein Tco_0003116 [Tanacetum coccineum]